MDPFPRTRPEKIDYGEEAAHLYAGGEYANVQEAFEEDFLYWTEDHFKFLPNAVISNIRDALIQDGVPIGKRPGVNMSKALADHTARTPA